MALVVAGEVRVPGDKSLTHRALMLAAAGEGESRLSGLLPGEDCRSTAAVLRALGCEIPHLPEDGALLRVRSGGLRGWREPEAILDCGNSGTTARLMLGWLAGRPLRATLTGDASLRSRPMRRVTTPLSEAGAVVRELELPDRLPLEIRGGALRPIAHRSPKASAQVKSALLLAGLSAGVPAEVVEPIRSRDHTERMLRSLGVRVTEEAVEGAWRVVLEPPATPLPGLEMDVPGDPSSAAFLAALAALASAGELVIRGVGTNPTRTGFVDVLRRMGGVVELTNPRESGGEPVADLVVRPGVLRGVEVGGAEVPSLIDEIPILAALAARAEGETVVTGADELRAKESDRIRAIVENLRAIGADAEELPDGLVVRGSERPLAGLVRTHHDHRIAMAFGVLAALPGSAIRFDDPSVVAVSYPAFWSDLRAAGALPDSARLPT